MKLTQEQIKEATIKLNELKELGSTTINCNLLLSIAQVVYDAKAMPDDVHAYDLRDLQTFIPKRFTNLKRLGKMIDLAIRISNHIPTIGM